MYALLLVSVPKPYAQIRLSILTLSSTTQQHAKSMSSEGGCVANNCSHLSSGLLAPQVAIRAHTSELRSTRATLSKTTLQVGSVPSTKLRFTQSTLPEATLPVWVYSPQLYRRLATLSSEATSTSPGPRPGTPPHLAAEVGSRWAFVVIAREGNRSCTREVGKTNQCPVKLGQQGEHATNLRRMFP
jgi:hypothetical protein